jgi:hypothetical protein
MPVSDRPKWPAKRISNQDSSKAARIVALYMMRDELGAVPKTHLAAALGISRWTLDRDIAALPEVMEYVEKYRAILQEEISHAKPKP